MAISHRRRFACLLPCALSVGCQAGLDYSGDERGLLRETIPVAGHTDRELSYLRAGDSSKQRVVFIHGSPGRSSMYTDYLRSLGSKAEVLAVDRLGYGESAGSGSVSSFEEQAAAIAPLLVEQDGRWPIVVGHSLGGPIATRLAVDNPGRVGALVIVAGGLNPELEETHWYNQVARWWIVYPFLAGFLRVSNREMWDCKEQVELLDPHLDTITCPIVLIHGTQDSLVPFETIDHSIRRFEDNPYLFVIVLIGEDHGVTKLRKEEVRETIEELLAGLKDQLEDAP